MIRFSFRLSSPGDRAESAPRSLGLQAREISSTMRAGHIRSSLYKSPTERKTMNSIQGQREAQDHPSQDERNFLEQLDRLTTEGFEIVGYSFVPPPPKPDRVTFATAIRLSGRCSRHHREQHDPGLHFCGSRLRLWEMEHRICVQPLSRKSYLFSWAPTSGSLPHSYFDQQCLL